MFNMNDEEKREKVQMNNIMNDKEYITISVGELNHI